MASCSLQGGDGGGRGGRDGGVFTQSVLLRKNEENERKIKSNGKLFSSSGGGGNGEMGGVRGATGKKRKQSF